jgi:hypothetical protein
MAESRGGVEDRQLMAAYADVCQNGTLMFGPDHHRCLTSKDIKMKKKTANIAGLQLADALAHPIKQYDLALRGRISPIQSAFGRQIVAAAEPKFNRNVGRGEVDGYGRVTLPSKWPTK